MLGDHQSHWQMTGDHSDVPGDQGMTGDHKEMIENHQEMFGDRQDTVYHQETTRR